MNYSKWPVLIRPRLAGFEVTGDKYINFRNFQPVIDKAREACAKSGHAVADHFAEMRNMVDIGSGANRGRFLVM